MINNQQVALILDLASRALIADSKGEPSVSLTIDEVSAVLGTITAAMTPYDQSGPLPGPTKVTNDRCTLVYNPPHPLRCHLNVDHHGSHLFGLAEEDTPGGGRNL